MDSHHPETACAGQQAFSSLDKLWKLHTSPPSSNLSPKVPTTSPERLASISRKTILYLAYGSNLSSETFKGARGIRPLSAISAHIPSLTLTFDLPGIPYLEPCFANTAYRAPPSSTDYHKDRWHKGLIGVVYEVTPEDYRTIIATEGGGASYQDIEVPCYAIPAGSKTVDDGEKGTPFLAHTLLLPRDEEKSGTTAGPQRPDPSYAQASARYLKLITDGADEHSLPAEYTAYLYAIRPYTITTKRQKAGQALFLAFWAPFILAMFGLGKALAGDDGRVPGWFASLMALLFRGMWASYDAVYK
ncbi:Gamma-glutamyl cyclotransferase gliK, partial [Lachnellula suecica]